MIPIITIEGPTASGKSDFALKLAKEYNTEIISADSRQVYKYLDIGTAKPDKTTQNEIKHHLIDIITPDQRYSAGAFVKDASIIIDQLHKQGKTPIICGGTMLYIKSLLEGLSEIPPIPENIIQKTKEYLNNNNLSDCYDFVKNIDPKFASSISPTDKQRISRCLEVWFAFNKRLTEFWEEQNVVQKYKPYKIYIDIDRDILYERINKRMLEMVKNGLLDEIKTVLKMGYTKDDFGLNTVGYKEFLESNNFDPIQLAAQHTRNYAKRQITWYRKVKFDLYNPNT